MGDSRQRTREHRAARRGAAVLAVLVGLGALLLGATPAWAHNALVEASPKKDAKLTAAPPAVKLTFLATLKSDGTKLTVTGPDAAAAAGPVTVSGKTVSAPFTGTAGGAYTVAYEVLSKDGHVVKGSYRFTLAVAESAAPSPSPVTESAQVSPSAAPVAASTAPVADTESGDPWWPWVGGAAVAGILVGGLVNLVKKRREKA
ncbi:copper resistance CopC family protein [Catellatospora sichuanensis]|uniref:copper resistance CopC family protein n=1 Tax=Catellatospora sichuanensis TaxID=1969805 RepID=UPI001FE5CC8B|nr:copper resistance CopC family protein [Catellatospora sichuanensis]